MTSYPIILFFRFTRFVPDCTHFQHFQIFLDRTDFFRRHLPAFCSPFRLSPVPFGIILEPLPELVDHSPCPFPEELLVGSEWLGDLPSELVADPVPALFVGKTFPE